MFRYERQVLTLREDGSVDVPGRVVSVLDAPSAGRSQITALVEVVDEDIPASTPTTFADVGGDSEGVEPTCAGKDGECSRTVGSPGDVCWQHDEDE